MSGRSGSVSMFGGQIYIPENSFISQRPNDHSSSGASTTANSFHERDFRLPELEFNNGQDMTQINLTRQKLKRVNTLKSEIMKEQQLLAALDDLEEDLPNIHNLKVTKKKADNTIVVNESKFAQRSRKVKHQAQMELNVLKHVIRRKPGELKDELHKHTKHLMKSVSSKDMINDWDTESGGESSVCALF